MLFKEGNWIRLAMVASFCQHGNKPVGIIKGKEFVYQLTNRQLFKKDSS
jgi:hypothetical protein